MATKKKTAPVLEEFAGIKNDMIAELSDYMDYYGITAGKALTKADKAAFHRDTRMLVIEMCYDQSTLLLAIAACANAEERYTNTEDYEAAGNLLFVGNLIAQRYDEIHPKY